MNKFFSTVAILSMATAISACQPKASPEDTSPVFRTLEGTKWQLIEAQSMDDSQPTLRPETKDAYTIEFSADGKLAVKLDCNRGMGTWKNAISNATGGSLELGPLATTRAMCRDPKIGDYLSKQFPYVRSFVIRDGKLYMSLMADGGIIAWERAK